MLLSLAIRDVVLIDRLSLDFAPGLSVLTGETGAGKSILLDALGLALGVRAEARLVRQGAQQASVTATFDPAADHAARAVLREQALDDEGGPLVLRRQLGADGKSRAFVNDQPVSVALLRQLGDLLVEVQGQFESRGLLDAASHRGLLDAFAGVQVEVKSLQALWERRKAAAEAVGAAETALVAARADESYLRHALGELDALAPVSGEEASLAEERQLLLNTGRILEALQEAKSALAGRGGAAGALAQASRVLDRIADRAGSRLKPVLDTLERGLTEVAEAGRQIDAVVADVELDPGKLERVEERFFALKDLARKHGLDVDGLAAHREALGARLASLDDGAHRLGALRQTAAAADKAFRAAAEKLSALRAKAGARLDRAVNAELPPLKLEKARFVTSLEPLAPDDWGAEGAERVRFLVATNPGASPGPLDKIASGGELARFLLALKVVLAGLSPVPTLIFDEVDAGVGGATADAVGQRLARLAEERQILVVTHSPQVAARGRHHWLVAKAVGRDRAATQVTPLGDADRCEEIARMLAGSEITEEARRAAAKLLETA